MKSHEIDYKVHGKDMQFVELELDKNETVIGEAGAMMYMHDGIDYEVKMGDGSKPNSSFLDKMLNVGKRVLTRESLFMTHYTNTRNAKSHVAFASPYPGKIIPMDLKKLRGEVICQKDSFLCAAKGTSISIDFAKKIGTGFFGGEGFILQKLQGDGMAFVHACGAVTLKKLSNETLRIDSGCIVAFTRGIDYDIQMVKGLKSMFFGGEGMFLATLSGTGYVWVQSLPFSRLADRIISAAPPLGGSKGESNPIGAIINMLGD
jgi:uncharacterized protein (TIGR00266 family)